MPNTSLFRGIIVPLVTPLADRDELDEPGLHKLLERVIDGGVHGVFLLGSTGEAPSLTERLKRELVSKAAEIVNRRIKVIVGITDTSLVDSIELAAFAAESRADAVVAAPPPYFPINQADLRAYVETLAENCELPLFMYNMPSHSKVAFELPTVRQLLHHPRIAGLKDSSGNMLYFNQVVQLAQERPSFHVFIGPEELLAESVLVGGRGGICGGANLYPELYVELYNAAANGDLATIHRLQHRVLRLATKLYSVGDPPSGYLTGLKCALSCMDICSGRLAEPLRSLTGEKKDAIVQHLQDLGLMDRQATAVRA
jgi:dihydrodipicolinate synthase/N-acetylneuraminate lyase